MATTQCCSAKKSTAEAFDKLGSKAKKANTVKFEFMVLRADTFLDLKTLVVFFSESYQRLPQERPPDVPLLPEDVPTEVQSAAAHPERSRERRNR